MTMACNNCLQEILEGEPFWEDETEGTVYHKNCRQAALDRRNKAEEERADALARVAELEAALAALKAGDAVGASTITQFLGARADLKITMTAIPWGENGLLEAPVILATIGDYLGHIFYTERSTTVEVALRALSAQITQSVEATEDKHHE
jgi:hypothetical protein